MADEAQQTASPGQTIKLADGSRHIVGQDGSLTPAPEAEKPGALESFGRAARQGATFDFYDELKGLVAGHFQTERPFGQAYTAARDEVMEANAAAKAEHPYIYGAGELAGGLATSVIPVGAAGKAVQAGSRVKQAIAAGKAGIKTGTLFGGVQGVGASEATDAAGVLRDGLQGAGAGGIIGGTVGGTIGAITGGKVLGEATKRAAADTRAEVVGAAPATFAKKVAQNPHVPDVLEEPANKALRKGLGDTGKALEIVDRRMTEAAKPLDALYDKFDKTAGGVSVNTVLGKLMAARDALAKNPGNRTLRNALDEMADDVAESWGNAPGGKVPTSSLRKYTTNVQKAAAKTMGSINETAAHELKSELRDVVKGILDQHLDAYGSRKFMRPIVDDIRKVNRQYSALATVQEALEAREYKELTKRSTLGGTIGKAVAASGAMTAAGMIGSGRPGAAAASLAAGLGVLAAPAARKAADRGLMGLTKAADRGNRIAETAERAIVAGPSESAGKAASGDATEMKNAERRSSVVEKMNEAGRSGASVDDLISVGTEGGYPANAARAVAEAIVRNRNRLAGK